MRRAGARGGGERAALQARGGRRGPGGGGRSRSRRGARRINPSAAGPSRRRCPSRGRWSGCRHGGGGQARAGSRALERAERSAGTRRSGARGTGGPGRQTGVPAPQLQPLQARPAVRSPQPLAERGPRALSPVRPRPHSAWQRGAETTARPGHPKPSAGPGRARVGGGPPGPPMGSGCRCGGATSRRRTPSSTPSSASLRARVSGGGGKTGRGLEEVWGVGPVLPSVDGGRARAVCSAKCESVGDGGP